MLNLFVGGVRGLSHIIYSIYSIIAIAPDESYKL
jgi:hypothetical protein